MAETPRKRPGTRLDVHVIIPYVRLQELLEAAERAEKMEYEIKRLRQQQAALHNLFTDLMERFREIY